MLLLLPFACTGSSPNNGPDDSAETDSPVIVDSDSSADSDTSEPDTGPHLAGGELVWQVEALGGTVVGVDVRSSVVVAVSDSGVLGSWDLDGGAERFAPAAGNIDWKDVALSPDGGSLVAGGEFDNHGFVLDSATGEEVTQLLCSGNNAVIGVAWDSLDSHIATATAPSSMGDPEWCEFKTSPTWDNTVESGSGEAGHQYSDVAFSPSGRSVAAMSDGYITVVVNGDGDSFLLSDYINFSGSFERGRIAWADDDAFAFTDVNLGGIVCGSASDNTNRALGVCPFSVDATAVAYSPDGQFLAATMENGTVKVANVTTGAWELTLDAHSGSAWAVRWSEDGKTLVTGGKNPSVAAWTLEYE